MVSVVGAVGLFLSGRLDFGVSLKDLLAAALPYKEWEQELDEFGVEGIPHLAFLDRNDNEEGNVVGKLPKKYILENVDAFASGKHPSHMLLVNFQVQKPGSAHPVADPRSHG